MELSEFISKTIVEIAKGVEQAKEDLGEIDLQINPTAIGPVAGKEGHRYIQQIEMNIAVTTEEKGEGQSGIGVITGLFSAGTKVKSEDLSRYVTTIKFSIPISLPVHGVPGQFLTVQEVADRGLV